MSDYNQIESRCNHGNREGRVSGDELVRPRAALGNATELRTPPKTYTDKSTGELVILGRLGQSEAIKEARRLRYRLQDSAREILYKFHGDNVPVNADGFEVHHRTCTCTRFRTASTTQIVKSNTNSKAFYAGLMQCANARTCPICAAKINERKANEMRAAANQLDALGLHFNLMTFTAPHSAHDKIEDLVPKISDALSSFWRGAPAKRFREKYGIVGNIRSFEVRYGSNGWHPHFHIIVVSKKPLPCTSRNKKGHVSPESSQDLDWLWVLNRWKTMTVKSGLSCPNLYGLDIQNGQQAGEYITKFGSDGEILETKKGKSLTWDMADEMTKGHTKIGIKGSLSPWDLLALAVDADSQSERSKAKTLFLFYARAMKGVTQIKWSRGLRDIFGLGKEITDEEILKQEEDKADFLCHITPVEWRYIIQNNMRDIVLDLAENGGSQAVGLFLHGIGSSLPVDKFLFEFRNRNQHANLPCDEDYSRVVPDLLGGCHLVKV